jgi:IS30 family transposase
LVPLLVCSTRLAVHRKWVSERVQGRIEGLREEGLSIREIAERTGVPKSTVGDILSRGSDDDEMADDKADQPKPPGRPS